MRNSSVVVSAVLLAALLSAPLVFGHEYHGSSHIDPQMQKLHVMMPMFAAESATLQAALEREDASAVAASSGKILTAVPDLKKSKPHKHASQRKRFAQLASQLGQQAGSVADQAKRGDFSGARKTFARLKDTCDACHAAYRD